MALRKEEKDANKGSKGNSKVDKDLEYFILPDVDNWTGYMGKVWGEDIHPLRSIPHRNLEKHDAYWEKLRTAELEARKLKK